MGGSKTKASSPAKITRPQPGRVFERSRLFHKLDQGSKGPLIWVCGPPGAGKTVLISSYLSARKRPCLWYQADAGDADPASFFHYLGLAAKWAAPRERRPLPHLTAEYLGGVAVFARRYFEALAARLKAPCALVLDNYQEVPAEAPLHAILREGLSALPEGITTIVISRSDPPPEQARLVVHENAIVIGQDDLQLTLEEAEGIQRLVKPAEAAPVPLAQLHQSTRGWTAGLILMLGQDQARAHTARSLADSSPQLLFDYFAGEIFARIDGPTQNMLLASALLPKMTAPMVARLTGFAAAGRVLEDLSHRNYFTLRHPRAEAVYEYHPLFREFLRNRLGQLFAPAALNELQKRAAVLLEADGQTEEAAELLQRAGEWEGLVRFISKHAPVFAAQGRGQVLEALLASLPAEILAENPWCHYWWGLCRLPFSPQQARAHFENAYRRFRQKDDLAGRCLAWCAIVDSFVYEWGNFKPLEGWIAEMEELLRERPSWPSPEVERQVACGMFLALMYPRPDHPDLPVWERRVSEILLRGEDVHLQAKVAIHLLIYYTWWIGDLAKAEMLVDTLGPRISSPGTAPLLRTAWHAMAAAFYWMSARNADCLDCVDRGLEIGGTSGVHVWDFLLCAQGVFASLSSDDPARAKAYLAHMEALLNTARPMDVAIHRYFSAWYRFVSGDVAGAREFAQTALAILEGAGARFQAAVFRNDLGRVMYYAGDRAAAEALVAQARTEGRAMKAQTLEYLTFLVEAEIALEAGDPACIEHLRRTLAVGRAQRFQNHTWWSSKTMARLYAEALAHGIETEYVRGLIRKRNLLPPENADALESWPRPFRIYTLGRFAIFKDEAPLQSTGKSQRKPLELLKALIAFGAASVGEETLIEAVWPELEGDNARQAFDTALYRLRKLLGRDDALLLKEGKLVLEASAVWVDSQALERALDRAEAASHGSAPAAGSLARIAQDLFALYRGHFLVEEGAPWALPARERLRSRFLRALEQLGGHWEAHAAWEEAARCYQRGLELEPLAERLYQRLMRCYQRSGRCAEALLVYGRCRQTLSRLLGVAPSAETETLRRALDPRSAQ